MNPDMHLDILRAVLRCHRHRRPADLAALELRVLVDAPELRGALRVLERAGLVRLLGSEVKLSFEGFAVAVASLAGARKRSRSTQKRAA